MESDCTVRVYGPSFIRSCLGLLHDAAVRCFDHCVGSDDHERRTTLVFLQASGDLDRLLRRGRLCVVYIHRGGGGRGEGGERRGDRWESWKLFMLMRRRCGLYFFGINFSIVSFSSHEQVQVRRHPSLLPAPPLNCALSRSSSKLDTTTSNFNPCTCDVDDAGG